MSPPIHRDWWLAAALTGAALPATVAQPAAPGTGVAATVTRVTPNAAANSTVYIENARGQKLSTTANQTLHVLFSDQSALTVGPGSELEIEEYRYDPQTKDGSIRVSLTKGLVRVVGGAISKKNETVVRTPGAKVGILGGISVVELDERAATKAAFLFGQRLSISSLVGGSIQYITRQGFGGTVENGLISEPTRIPASVLSQLLARMDLSSPNNQPVGAPPGPLLNTGNTPGGVANDRLQNIVDNNAGAGASDVLKNLLGTDAGQPRS